MLPERQCPPFTHSTTADRLQRLRFDDIMDRMNRRRVLWTTGVSLGLVWFVILLPLLAVGFLWGGGVPLWPPVESGSHADFEVWLLSFTVSYGLPPLSCGLMFFGRSARHG
jgi:hypothetical protein